MYTLAPNKEVKAVGPKEILLTLKKDPKHCCMTAVIAPIGKNRKVKITDKKLIKINSKNDHEVFLKETHSSEKFVTDDQFLPRVTQVSMKNRKNLLNTKQCLILDSALISGSQFCQKFSEIIYKRQITDNQNNTVPLAHNLGESRSKTVVSNLNKPDRFVPNILRSTKMSENTFNNNSLIGFNPRLTASSHRTEKHSKDQKNVKRKRKQVLSSLNIKRDWTRRARLSRKKNELDKLLQRIRNYNLAEESETEAVGITAISSEQVDDNECPESKPEGSPTAEELTMDPCNPNDSYTADLDIPCRTQNLASAEEVDINCSTDKSIKKILAEFEVADYQNYIDSEDLGIDIDEMDNLLNSNIDTSLTESSIFNNDTKIVNYDVNGNDIDNHGSPFKKLTDKNVLKTSDIQCKIEPCYEDGVKPETNTTGRLEWDINSDGICSGASDNDRSFELPEMNLWSTEFEDYYSSDDFQDFHFVPDEESSSTDTASKSENNEPNSTQSSSLVLPKIEKLGCVVTSFAVSDIVPDDVLSDDPNALCIPSLESHNVTAKQPLDSSLMMQQYRLNSSDCNDNKYRTSLPDIPLERLTTNLQLYDGFDATFGPFEDGNFLIDEMLSINCAVSKEDETCETILANSNAKFDDKHILNMHSNLSDIDIENADDIEISKLLRLGNTHTNNLPSVPHPTLQPYEVNAPYNELTVDMPDLLNTTSIFTSNHNDSQFCAVEFQNSPQAQAENSLNESIYSHLSEGVNFSFENGVEVGPEGYNINDRDFEHSNSASGNLSSRIDELLGFCDAESKDIDSTKLSSCCSPPFLVEKRIVNELKMSKLKSLLTQTQNCVDYQSTCYPSSISRNVIINSKIGNNELRSQVPEHFEVDIFDSTISSNKSFHCQITGYKNIGDTSRYSYTAQERNVTGQGTVIYSDDDYSVAKRRNHHLLELDLSRNQHSYNCQSISYSLSSEKPAMLSKPSIDLRKQNEGVWKKDLSNRSKTVTKNMSYIPCEFCEKKYRSEAVLADHIKFTHRYRPSRFRYRNKKYVCDKCSKEYSLAGAIEKHFKLHENYMLTCKICGKHFSEKVYLRRHVHGAHLHWKLQCSYCGRKFPRKNTLTHHLKKCHGLQECCSESLI